MTKPETLAAERPAVTMQQLFNIGLADVAYVKTVRAENSRAYALHSADGTEIARFADRDVAFAASRQHDLEPVSAH